MRRSLLLAGCLLSVILYPGIGGAQLLMEKSRVEETADPGDTIIDKIILHNNSDRSIELTVYWEDFEYIPPFDGKKKFMLAGTGERSMAGWITFSPAMVTIPPREKRDVNFTIRVPRGAKGTHHGVLFFEQGTNRRVDGTGLNIVTRVGALFFIESTARDRKASLGDVRLQAGQLQGDLLNEGDTILFPRGVYYIMDGQGFITARGEVPKIYLPPTGRADFSIDLPHDLKEGEYTLVLTFDLAQGESVVKEADFKKGSEAAFQLLRQRN